MKMDWDTWENAQCRISDEPKDHLSHEPIAERGRFIETITRAPQGSAIEAWKQNLFFDSMFFLGVITIYWLLKFIIHTVKTFIRQHKDNRSRAIAFLFFSVVATCAAQKAGTLCKILFPRTATDLIYVADVGSAVSNDCVYVNFTRHPIVPATANLYIDYCDVADTNLTNVATLVATTFAEFSVPTNIPFAGATNFNWYVYTDWTPGPAVQTNGVWHAYWGEAKGTVADEARARGLLWGIPVKTEINENGTIICPPIQANLLDELNKETENE